MRCHRRSNSKTAARASSLDRYVEIYVAYFNTSLCQCMKVMTRG